MIANNDAEGEGVAVRVKKGLCLDVRTVDDDHHFPRLGKVLRLESGEECTQPVRAAVGGHDDRCDRCVVLLHSPSGVVPAPEGGRCGDR